MKQSYPEIVVNGEAGEAVGPAGKADPPSRTVVDFSRLKIASRLLIGLILLGGCALFTVLLSSDDERVAAISWAGPILLALLGIWFSAVSAYHLFVRRSVITIDAEGLAFLKHEPISWSDVRSVGIRVTPGAHDLFFQFLKVTPQSKRAPFEVEFTHTTTGPDQLMDILKRYVAAYREHSGQAT